MPELPDVEIFKKEAEKALNKRVDHVKIRDRDFVEASRYKFNKHIEGNDLRKVWRKGKYLFLETGDHYSVVLHFGMTGLLKYAPGKEGPPEYTKLTFEMGDGHHLHYISKRKLGSVEITGEPEAYTGELDLGPDALQLEEDAFTEKIKASRASVKSFLMDQSALSGIGNVYSDEMLYQAGIHPKADAGKLSDKETGKLFRKMKYVLEMAIEKEADVSRMPRTWLLPHREEGAGCPKCDGKIKTIKVTGRTTYYCPSCQKE